MSDTENGLVILSGEMTITSIGATHAELGAVLREHRPAVLDISGVTQADLTFIQLLEAARRSAADAGRNLTLRHAANGAVLEILQRGGFLEDDDSDRAMFWLQGELQQ